MTRHVVKGSTDATPRWAWFALAAVIVLAACVRVRLLEVPLERDEGEYAYFAQLILDGVPPYTQAFNMKLPGIYAAYALVLTAFGESREGIHAGLLLVNAVTIVLVFLLARRWLGPPGAAAAAAAFAVLSMGQPVQGVFANAEHFVLPFALGGLVLLQRPSSTARTSVLAGVFLGVGFLMKQHGAAFALLGVIFALTRAPGADRWRGRVRRALWVSAGVLSPYAVTCLIFAALGAFDGFWFWTVEYAHAYASQLPLGGAPAALGRASAPIVAGSPVFWSLAAAGLAVIWIDPGLRPRAGRILAFASLSFLAVCPGLFFRPHYFVLTLPAAAVLVGASVQATSRLAGWWGPFLAATLALGASADALVRQGSFLFRMPPAAASRATYGANPFPESVELARYIREHSSPEDRVAILGSEPQILFYSQRRSVTGHIYTYAMMEPHEYARRMQREMIGDIEAGEPRFLVFVRVDTSWLQRRESRTDIFDWFGPYQEEHYRLVGLVEIRSSDATLYHWGDTVPWPPSTRQWIALFERHS